MSKNSISSISNIFHILIIAMFLLGLNGCGYKASPFYTQDAPLGDENVTFKLNTINVENNESAACVKKK
ncbi:MAG: hypothetical protein Q9M32_07415 [Sulfurimonas sp.]|nr:hypothetical protein [Sulfurimonas sp.]MDQ7059810.1 hypothetical protein [Sulfurimonas sp.]